MKYFQEFVSNTNAGSGNQYFFENADATEIQTGRLFYKIFGGGAFRYSLLFSNCIDSTFADGSLSQKNRICDGWKILKASVGVCRECNCTEMAEVSGFKPLTFGGLPSKEVMPGEFFASDAITLNFKSGEYLCLEISFCGKMIPYHEETLIPTFLYENGAWVPSKKMPFPGMIGCDRAVDLRIGFMGDSITQGIGIEANSYDHWNSQIAQKLGDRFSYWNLGLGYGRADDAGSNGAWLFKAKQVDVTVLCFGANDINRGYTAEQIKNNLAVAVKNLKAVGQKILLQTVPPFDYGEALRPIWAEVNEYIKNTLSGECDAVFDVVPILAKDSAEPYMAKYGGHPNAEGCKAWAAALYPVLKALCDKE